jgi:pyridoxamine 5'-phosphate oxidase
VTVAIGLDGFPKSRVVLLKKFTEEGFIFTLIIIRKRQGIEANPQICFFFWHSMERQVIIKGSPKEPQKSFLIIILIQDQKFRSYSF